MKLGCKFWIAFRVAVLRRGFGSMRPLLSRASFSVNVGLGGGGNVLWCGCVCLFSICSEAYPCSAP
jgi:hypothetical protein